MDIREATRVLGLHEALEHAQRACSLADAKKRLVGFKEEAEKHYRTLAFDAHPDRGGDEERMKVLNQAITLVRKIHVRPMVPMVQVMPIMVRIVTSDMGFGSFSSSTTTSTGSW